MSEIKIGCCGFPVAKERYFQTFSVVELQQTFYQLPLLETAQRWREEAPEGFEFTLKASQLITHETSSPTYRRYKVAITEEKRANYGSFKPSEEVMEAWARTREIALALRARIIVLQCPPGFAPTQGHKENMRRFFNTLQRDNLTLVWEPRGQWQAREIEELCKKLDLVHGVDPFKNEPVYGKLKYFRLHGKTGYTYRFTGEDLSWLRGICRGKGAFYCMFNNISMFDDAHQFKTMAEG